MEKAHLEALRAASKAESQRYKTLANCAVKDTLPAEFFDLTDLKVRHAGTSKIKQMRVPVYGVGWLTFAVTTEGWQRIA